jgi:hypothetical protein
VTPCCSAIFRSFSHSPVIPFPIVTEKAVSQ